MSQLEAPDVTEMAAVHRVFRKAFTVAPQFIGKAPDGDTARAAVVAGYYSNVLEFLRVHHDGEDALLFPKLRERASDVTLFDQMSADHEAVHAALDGAVAAVERWQASASATDAAALIACLHELEAALLPHLDAEEERVLPLVSEHITCEEWGELPGHAMGMFSGDNLFLILGLVRDEMTQEQRDRMLQEMPPPAVEAWKAVGIDAYAGTIKALVGAPA